MSQDFQPSLLQRLSRLRLWTCATVFLGGVFIATPAGCAEGELPVPSAVVEPREFFNLAALGCMAEMGTLGHHGFSYSSSLDAFVVAGVFEGQSGLFFSPVAPSRGTNQAPKVFFLDVLKACPLDARHPIRGSQISSCTVQALAGVQPVEFFIKMKDDGFSGFATRPALMLGAQVSTEKRFSIPEVTSHSEAQKAMRMAMSDWIDFRSQQESYYHAILDPHGKRHTEMTEKVVEAAKAISVSLDPMFQRCLPVKQWGFDRQMAPFYSRHLELKGFAEDAERELIQGHLRRPAGYAP